MPPLRLALIFVLLFSLPVPAQDHAAHMKHMNETARTPVTPPMAAPPTLPGQDAFGAIQEIEEMLEADPSTDWSKVDIEALRRHLIDMNNVTLAAEVKSEPIDDGMRFVVTGTGPVAESVRRMVISHAATMNGTGDWRFDATPAPTGAVLTVHVPAEDAAKLRGLGFIGVMARGMHHQQHHLMIARGGNPHP